MLVCALRMDTTRTSCLLLAMREGGGNEVQGRGLLTNFDGYTAGSRKQDAKRRKLASTRMESASHMGFGFVCAA
jgi:hypothetical protein